MGRGSKDERTITRPLLPSFSFSDLFIASSSAFSLSRGDRLIEEGVKTVYNKKPTAEKGAVAVKITKGAFRSLPPSLALSPFFFSFLPLFCVSCRHPFWRAHC